MNVDRFPDTVAEPTTCITMDLEESFDVGSPTVERQVFDHLEDYIDRIQRWDIPVSMFVVGRTVEQYPEMIRRLDAALDVEFHLHSHTHDMSGEADIEGEICRGIDAFESVLGRRPVGYRAPRYLVTGPDLEALSAAGFEFDSSICPSYRPGVYDHLDKPREPFYPAVSPDLLELPISVHPQLRVPITQSFMRLLGTPFLKLLEYSTLPDLLIYNSHLHDYYRTDAHDMLPTVKKALFSRNMADSVDLFERFLTILEDHDYRFRTVSDVAATLSDTARSPSVAHQQR
jgi:peptidoglycan/xylan/chitin deacetylase (PgdA/CDA1 family)